MLQYSQARVLEGAAKSQFSVQGSSFHKSSAPPEALDKRSTTFFILSWKEHVNVFNEETRLTEAELVHLPHHPLSQLVPPCCQGAGFSGER